jgi:ribosomal protein S18 acetylase RimI-like enzyme
MARAWVHNGCDIDDDPRRVDFDALWSFLGTEAYWRRWRTRQDVEHEVAAAWRVVGVYTEAGEMVGFARSVSDGSGFGYLADVYVLGEHRGRGLGKALVQEMIDNGPGASFRWLLFTKDAHDLYRSFGFSEPGPTVMERPGPRPAPA